MYTNNTSVYVNLEAKSKALVATSPPFLQPYIADIASGNAYVGQGLEHTGTPEGIPSLAEYLAEYCSSGVSHTHNGDDFHAFVY